MKHITLQLVLRKDKTNKKGLAPIYIRLTQNRETKFISLKEYIDPVFWNPNNNKVKRSHPNSSKLNYLLERKLAEYKDILYKAELGNMPYDLKSVAKAAKGEDHKNLLPFFYARIKRFELAGEINNSKKLLGIYSKIKKYIDSDTLLFQEVTYLWIDNYVEYLRTNKKNMGSTIHGNIKELKTVFNEAIKKGVISPEDFKFKDFSIKQEKPKIEFLEDNEREIIEGLPLEPNSNNYYTREMFVFAMWTEGIRISDLLLLKWDDYINGHVLLHTEKNEKPLKIKVPEKGIEILKRMKIANNTSEYVFPFMERYFLKNPDQHRHNGIRSCSLTINKCLKKLMKADDTRITKSLHFHMSRHTFAVRALRKGISLHIVSKLLAHAKIQQTMVYVHLVDEDLDKAMDLFDL